MEEREVDGIWLHDCRQLMAASQRQSFQPTRCSRRPSQLVLDDNCCRLFNILFPCINFDALVDLFLEKKRRFWIQWFYFFSKGEQLCNACTSLNTGESTNQQPADTHTANQLLPISRADYAISKANKWW